MGDNFRYQGSIRSTGGHVVIEEEQAPTPRHWRRRRRVRRLEARGQALTLDPIFAGARWRGPVPNKTPGAMGDLLGLVLHVEQGTEAGTDSWFHNPGSEVSAHLGVGSYLEQWVKFDDRAWAEEAGNSRWLSIETAGHNTEALDSDQLHLIAQIYAHLHAAAGFPFRTSELPTEAGFGWHGMGGSAWGDHLDCPGDKRKAQRAIILAKAITLVHPDPAKTPQPSAHPVTPAYPGQPLKMGDSSHAIKVVSEHLQARGWRIDASRHYSRQLEHVVAEFQAEKHLRVDGIIGPVTWWAIWHLPVTS